MTKSDRIPLAALILLALALWIPWMRGPIDLRMDGGVYYILGTSLAEGKGYRLLNEPGDPQAVQYPPLLPLLIAGQQRLLGTSEPVIVGKWLKLTYQLMLMGCAALTYLLARRWVSRWPAFLAAVMFLLSLWTYYLGSLAYADMPFALASLLFLLPRRQDLIGDIWSGLWAVAAYLLRSIGITLLITWVGEALLRARWKTAIVRAAVAILPVILWQGYVHRVESSQSYQHPAYAYQRAPYQFNNVAYSRNIAYVDPFRPELGLITRRELVVREVANLLFERRSFAETVTTGLGFWGSLRSWIWSRLPLPVVHIFTSALSYGITALMLCGLASMISNGEVRIPLYIVLSALAIAGTPWPDLFGRYFWSLSPLLAIAFMVGMVATRIRLNSVGGMWRQAGSAFLIIVVAAAIAVESAVMMFNRARPDLTDATYVDAHNVVRSYHLFYYFQRSRRFDRAVDWIKQETAPNAVVVTSCPHYVYLKSGRKAVLPPLENNPLVAQELLDSVPASYLIADDLGFFRSGDLLRPRVDSVTRQYPTLWKVVATIPNSKTVVYQRVGGALPPSASAQSMQP
jgi:hypothetical protein